MRKTARRLKTMIVEDSPHLSEILATIVKGMPGLELVAVVDNAADALVGFEQNRPGLIILDLVLAKGTGFDVLRGVKRIAPECRVLIFTAHDAEQYRVRCMADGADYFLSKVRQARELTQLLAKLSGMQPAPAP
jgi:DNA-binding NarL/FixJ family response regulator